MSVKSWLDSRTKRRAQTAATRERRRCSFARRRIYEQLEDRRLLASDWQNNFMPSDVNNDLRVTALDALLVINQLPSNGDWQLPTLDPGTKPIAYYDTTGDSILSALDTLRVINDIGATDDNFRDAPPRAIDVIPVNGTTLLATYDRPMGASAINPANYVVTSDDGERIAVLSAKFGEGESVVQLQTAPQTSTASYNVNLQNVTDTSGQLVFFEGRKITGNPKGAVVSVAATSPGRVVVVFNEPMADNALGPQHYDIKDASGRTLLVTDAKFDGPLGMVVVLTTETQSKVPYRLTVSVVTDLQNDGLQANTGNFQGIAGFTDLVTATPSGPNSVLMTFSQAMSDDALSPSSYVIKNSVGVELSVLEAKFLGTERRLVQLVTGPQAPGIYTIQSMTATDGNGNRVSAPGPAGVFVGVPAPSLIAAIPPDSTHVFLTFGSPLSDSGLAPSSYKLEKLDSHGNVTNALPISEIAFVGSQRTVVSLTTPHQSDARYRITTTSGLSDVFGSPLAVVASEFQGLGSVPKVTNVTSTDPTTIQVIFNVPMSDDALQPSLYNIEDSAGVRLPIYNVQFLGTERRLVQLTTGPQASSATYTVVSINATDTSGGTTTIPASSEVNSFPGPGTTGGNSVPIDGPPRVVGAASLSNTSVLVAFSEPMDDNALNTSHYFMIQQSINPEVGYVPILGAVFYSSDHRSVLLSTGSQNELTYSITAVNVTDQAGNAIAPAVFAGQQRIDPTTASFPGNPASGTQVVDTDGDGLSDNIEVRGWTVSITLVNGDTVTRQVTSDPHNPDTDGDKLWDSQELNIGTDPRWVDTDGDQINDWAEFNEIFIDPTNQDTDGDSLDDFREFVFFKTSPYLADSDGDQMTDDYEILANRNPRVSDLPRPEITVGQVNLQLDVRFSETSDQQRRDLETKSVTASLSRGASQSFSRSDTVNLEAHLEGTAGFGDGTSSVGGFFRVTSGGSVGYTFEQSSESATEMQQSYESSLSTDKEVTRGFSVERNVEGAVMQVAIDLRNLSTLAYRVKNLQVTAFIQDPQDHSKLTPLATLLPDSEPEEGFTLGALSKDRGPFIFSNSTIIPSLVESLMANSSGLVFRISNYDIIDESGRNFAFTSQEIVERTARMVIDYGGASSLRALLSGEAFDELQPGDETEIFRVATSAGDVIDTNFDGVIDNADHRAIFDGAGKEVGITLFEGLAAVGLTQYDESATPTNSLSDEQILKSYSTFVDTTGRERIFRIRGVSNDTINEKYWEILTPLGIDQVSDLSDLILKTDSPVSLNFVQDLDMDGLSADVEFFLRTSDSPMSRGAEVPGTTDFATDETVTYSTDPELVTGAIVRVTATGGGLTANTNYYVRNLGRGSYSFFDTAVNAAAMGSTVGRIDLTSKITAGIFTAIKPTSTNTTTELVTFSNDPKFPTGSIVQVTNTGGGLTAGTNYVVRNLGGGSYNFYDSALNATANSDVTTGRVNLTGNITAGIFSPTAKGRDTDGDGLRDRFEVFQLASQSGTPDYVLDPSRKDTDSDGINDATEIIGFKITPITGAAPFFVTTNPNTPFTDSDTFADGFERILGLDPTSGADTDDDGDGLTDYEEFFAGTDPTSVDSDRDGIEDRVEYFGYSLGHKVGENDLGIIKTNPLDADTDNDKRSDGAEAELVDIELTRWVVRAEGKTPYRVYSDPLFADSDFDGVVDGDEFSGVYRTDPNNGNTDGDQFDDGQEFIAGTNPLKLEVDLFRVTVFFNSIQVTADGDWDPGDEGGDFAFDFGVRLPGTGTAGLSQNFTSVVHDSILLGDEPFTFALALNDQQVEPLLSNPSGQTPARSQQALQNNQYSRGIAFDSNHDDTQTLNLARYLSTGQRSITFWMSADQVFSVEGILAELDANGENHVNIPDAVISGADSPSTYAVFYNYMGGIDGLQAREKGDDTAGTTLRRPVFRGSELQTLESAFVDYEIVSTRADQLGTRSENGDSMAGTLSFTIFVG